MEQRHLKFLYSEQLIEHLFIGGLISLSWLKISRSIYIAINILIKVNLSENVQILVINNSRGERFLHIGEILTGAISFIFLIFLNYQIELSFAKKDVFPCLRWWKA